MGFLETGNDYKKDQEYLKDHPVEQLRQTLAKQATKVKEDKAKEAERFESTVEVVELREQEKQEIAGLERIGANQDHIKKTHQRYDVMIRNLIIPFNRGKLTPIKEEKKVELTTHEKTSQDLKAMKENIEEMEKAIEKFKNT